MNILFCTLGTSWAVVPEIWGYFPGNSFELYAHHPDFSSICAERSHNALYPLDRIECVTTYGESVSAGVENLQWWADQIKIKVEVHRIAQTANLDNAEECQIMREAIFRHVLRCHEQAAHLYISLAGGRKTMSADAQRAAGFFGCHGLLHVVDTPEQKSQRAPQISKEEFCTPVSGKIIRYFRPVFLGSDPGQRVSRVAMPEFPALHSDNYPSSEPGLHGATGLQDAVEQRIRTGEDLLVNFSHTLMAQDPQSAFLALYRLSPEVIDAVKAMRLGQDTKYEHAELSLLRSLPKAELHCHLGGICQVQDLITVALANEHALRTVRNAEFARWRSQISRWIRKRDVEQLSNLACQPKEMPKLFLDVAQPLVVSAFLLALAEAPDILDALVFGALRHESTFHGIGIDHYERLGDLQGSSLLQNEASLRAVCAVLRKQCRDHNVHYLELRCSPEKYTLGGLSASEVVDILTQELGEDQDCVYRLIFIGSRHGDLAELQGHVQLMVELLERDNTMVVGFDLAGNEKAAPPIALRHEFMPLMEKCLRLTIHAGETVPASSIWQAIYHLSADRIGHGLTLIESPELLTKIRDRRIALEMCPSSNVQIVGYRDAYLPETAGYAVYPLKHYMQQGLRVTVNTDNPGISRTNQTQELHRACRLTPRGLSLWDILILLRQGFRSAFADDLQRQLLLRAEEKVIRQITQAEFLPSLRN